MIIRILHSWSFYMKFIQQNFNGSNTDGSFTTVVSNSFLSPSEKNHPMQICDNLG